jgi:CubicO group peptidase (beta-lactamase class C family)
VIVARKGTVVFHKAYGHHTYDKRIEVRKDDLFDLASVTKISGTLSGLMLLEGMGKFSYQNRLGDYCSAMKRSDKASLALKDVLTHQAGLFPWIPYHENTLKKNGQYKKRFVRTDAGEKFSLQVADRVYLSNTYKEKIFKEIRKSELGEKQYLYSGLSFFLFPTIIEELSGLPYETFLSENIYHRLGAWELLYHPRSVFPGTRIVPTEYDSLFRKQLVHGYVHDEGAALMGGYAGNAGLFASSNDLLKLIEMYRRMGNYGGEQIISETVLREYSSYQFPELENRRGLGFDKPMLGEKDGSPEDYPCPGASPSSFGHAGFTGTYVWADPEHEISYVFLSNRVHPTRQNNLLYDLDIRTSILQSVYDSIIEP